LHVVLAWSVFLSKLSNTAARRPSALVTGGASGIGLAIANAMVDAGYAVTATGLTAEHIQAIPSRPHLSAVQLDVTSPESAAAVLARFDELAALINCAGVIFRNGAEFDLETFQKVLDVNLTGTMRMCVASRAKLATARGCIVNTASMLSFFGGPAVPAYTASKGGVAQLTKALAVAWAPEGIRVNAIAPGWIATELTRGLVEDPARSAAILARTPMGRWGDPSDIGGVAVFLCSDAARFITGAILPVDGGYAAV
jgi:NAD(P)-dependent dehydrogenase (short-subunit alcohol dehydrogenase family)